MRETQRHLRAPREAFGLARALRIGDQAPLTNSSNDAFILYRPASRGPEDLPERRRHEDAIAAARTALAHTDRGHRVAGLGISLGQTASHQVAAEKVRTDGIVMLQSEPLLKARVESDKDLTL